MHEEIQSLNLFAGPEHEPFHLPGDRPVALLIHGYLGTPAEMRAVGDVLHEAGWTVRGLRLPGFGADIHTLLDRRWPEWVAAARRELVELTTAGEPALVVGFSLGGAIALLLAAAAPERVGGLALLAPFSGLLNRRWGLVWAVLKHIVRRWRPLRKVDFADPRLRDGVGGLLPELDLDDPAVQVVLRQLVIPSAVPDQLTQVARAVKRAAPSVTAPALVLQGKGDETVRPDFTRRLVERLGGEGRYVEVAAGHDLVEPDRPAWPRVRAELLAFAHSVTGQTDRNLTLPP